MPDHAEIERTYDVEDGTALPPLAELAGGRLAGVAVGSVVVDDEVTLEAEYVDTEGLDLARNAIALRRRAGGADAGWHLKLPAAEGRTELQWPADAGGDVTAPPAEVLDPVRAIVRDRGLRVIARLTTRRTATRLLGEDGGGLVEVVDDRVTATDAVSGELRIWREWEAELADGRAGTVASRTALLDAVEERLIAAGATTAEGQSKLARTLGRTSLGEPARAATVVRETAASEVLLVVLRGLVADVVRLDPAVRRDEPDGVHQLRTRVRRIRGVLKVFRDVVDRGAASELDDELSWLGGVLGGTRDSEVMSARSEELVDDHEGVARSVRDRLVGAWDERRAVALGDLRVQLSGERYYRLLDALDDLLARPALGPAAFEPVARVAPAVLLRAARTVRRRAREADAVASDLERTPLLHAIRKAAKRLRYAAEAVSAGDAAVFGGKVRRVAAAAERVHDLLGEHRDSVLLRTALREWAPESRQAFDYGKLHELERHSAALCLAELPGALADLERAAARLR